MNKPTKDMKLLKGFFDIILCIIFLLTSLGTFISSSFLGQLFAKSGNIELGITILLIGFIACLSCLFTIKTIMLSKSR